MNTNFDNALWEKILTIDLHRVFDRLVYKLNFTTERAEKAIEGYRQYLYLINTVGNLTPSEDADEAWHAHVLHLPSYVRDCMATFGRMIWHIPKPIINGKTICSGECQVGSNNRILAIGTDCEAFHQKTKQTSFVINVPIDEYANVGSEEVPRYEEFVSLHFT